MSAFEPPGHGSNGNVNGNGNINDYHPHPQSHPHQQAHNNGHNVNHGQNGSLSQNPNHALPIHQGHGVAQSFAFDGQHQIAHHHHHQQQQQQQQFHAYAQQASGPHTPDNQQVQQFAPTQSAQTPTDGEGNKGNRLRKACDSCSIRKVKCDESGPPCRACAALDIPCTRERPSRRRGPPNRHAEAIKKRRLESPGGGSFSSPTSPNNVAATLASFSSHAVLNAESICPFDTLQLLVDDFFTYIHPLCPFPHEPSFRQAFRQREDLTNPAFLALLASMVGALVASFPRKPKLHLKNHQKEHLFPNSISLVERCHKVAVEARGSGYLDKELTVYDAATSYFLGLSAAYTFQWRQCRLYFGETMTISRVLGAHKVKDPGFMAVGDVAATYGGEVNAPMDTVSAPVDYIKQEIGRRIFWIMFACIRSMQQFGASFSELIILPPTPNEPYPPFPLEVDDEHIYIDHIDPQPQGVISKLTGFNCGVKIYLTVSPLATMELAYGIDEVFDWNKQKSVLEVCLKQAKQALDNIPAELLLQTGSQPGGFQTIDRSYYPPATEYPGARSTNNGVSPWQSDTPNDARRSLQFEIQKANIYASQLGTRSYLVEKYWNLQELYNRGKANSGSPAVLNSPGLIATGLDGLLPKQAVTSNFDNVENIVVQERESIVQDLLQVLGSINQVNMEPNGGSFVNLPIAPYVSYLAYHSQINKIRQIASTLVETRKGPVAMKSELYLGKFLDVLMRLERVSPSVKAETGEVDEEEELRTWADLREYQMAFAQAGGFMSEIG